jgi:hypothetical protein
VRFVKELWRHETNASVAAVTALSTVATFASATFAETCPVAGLKTSLVRSVFPVSSAPFIQCVMVFV